MMGLVYLAIILFIFFLIILFSFPQFSPIPYYPSNMKDKKLILKALNMKNDQIIIDLGAGDGAVVFEAAKVSKRQGLSTRFIALEINPVLIVILYFRWLFHPNKKQISIVWGDMFVIDYKKQISTDLARLKPIITFYLYISPWLIEKAIKPIQKQIPACQLVSYYYPIKSLKQKEKMLAGIHNIYIYE